MPCLLRFFLQDFAMAGRLPKNDPTVIADHNLVDSMDSGAHIKSPPAMPRVCS